MDTIEEMKRFLAERLVTLRELMRQGAGWAMYAYNEDERLLRLIDEEYSRCDNEKDCVARINQLRSK